MDRFFVETKLEQPKPELGFTERLGYTGGILTECVEGLSAPPCPFTVGSAYFIRTVTYHLIGKVERIVGQWILLTDASWVADSGRFMNALKTGELNEVEPVGQAFVNMGSITDAFPWRHECPSMQK